MFWPFREATGKKWQKVGGFCPNFNIVLNANRSSFGIGKKAVSVYAFSFHLTLYPTILGFYTFFELSPQNYCFLSNARPSHDQQKQKNDWRIFFSTFQEDFFIFNLLFLNACSISVLTPKKWTRLCSSNWRIKIRISGRSPKSSDCHLTYTTHYYF